MRCATSCGSAPSTGSRPKDRCKFGSTSRTTRPGGGSGTEVAKGTSDLREGVVLWTGLTFHFSFFLSLSSTADYDAKCSPYLLGPFRCFATSIIVPITFHHFPLIII